MVRLAEYWWPAYVFVSPLLFWPWDPSRLHLQAVHAYATALFLVGGLLIGAVRRPEQRLVDLLQLKRIGGLKGHPVVLVALLFAAWILVATVFSPKPIVALTGSILWGSDGALWQAVYVGVFLSLYSVASRDPAVRSRIAIALVASACILAVLAGIEVVLHQPLFYRDIARSALPMTTFPQKGHLAGMFALGGGVAIGLWSVVGAFLLSAGIGLAVNRSAAGALLLTTFGLGVLAWRRKVAIVGLAVLLGLVAGWGIVRIQPEHHKQVASTHSFDSRLYYWKDALHGIAARPLAGWGGGVFELYWTHYLSRSDLGRFAASEWGFPKLLSAAQVPGSYPVFVAEERSGTRVQFSLSGFKVHDQVLEAALMWGIVGLALYLVLWLFALRGLTRGDPLALGLLAYAVFLLLWFVIPETRGIVWAVMGAASAATWRSSRARAATAEADQVS